MAADTLEGTGEELRCESGLGSRVCCWPLAYRKDGVFLSLGAWTGGGGCGCDLASLAWKNMGLESFSIFAEVGRDVGTGETLAGAETWGCSVEAFDLAVSGVLTKPRTVGAGLLVVAGTEREGFALAGLMGPTELFARFVAASWGRRTAGSLFVGEIIRGLFLAWLGVSSLGEWVVGVEFIIWPARVFPVNVCGVTCEGATCAVGRVEERGEGVGLWLFSLGLNSDSCNLGRKGGVDVDVVIVVGVVEEDVSWARRGVFGARARAGFNGTPGREGAVGRGLRLLAMMAYCYEEGAGRFVCTNVVRHHPIISTAICLCSGAGACSWLCRIRDRLLPTCMEAVKRRLPWLSRLDDVQVMDQSPNDAPAHQRPASRNFLALETFISPFFFHLFPRLPRVRACLANPSVEVRQLFGRLSL